MRGYVRGYGRRLGINDMETEKPPHGFAMRGLVGGGGVSPAGAGLDAHRSTMGLSIHHVLWPSGQPARPAPKLGGLGLVGHNHFRHSGKSIRSPLPISSGSRKRLRTGRVGFPRFAQCLGLFSGFTGQAFG